MFSACFFEDQAHSFNCSSIHLMSVASLRVVKVLVANMLLDITLKLSCHEGFVVTRSIVIYVTVSLNNWELVFAFLIIEFRIFAGGISMYKMDLSHLYVFFLCSFPFLPIYPCIANMYKQNQSHFQNNTPFQMPKRKNAMLCLGKAPVIPDP